MTTKRIRKLATVAATAALALQLFAGPASAAVPNATSSGSSLGAIGGDGWAGFTTSYTFQDNNIPKLFLEIDIVNGASVPQIDVTRNAKPANCGTVSATLIKCQFNSVKRNDTFNVTFAVEPASAGDVTVQGGWSTTGYVEGGNNSHGDLWGIGGKAADGKQITSLVARYNGDGDYAAGWGNGSLSTKVSNNKQSAKLSGLPANKWAAVNDAGGGSFGGFPAVDITVNGGAAANFTLEITYPKPTSAPKSYLHISDNYSDAEYFLCQN
ncbi:MAG TPA: hypothetical protein VFL03_09740, partial [Candidatus Limnocylindrales bacterium]|nr:hypothetical protein [Candidatus Limnocylindrales bacterium]